jgi:hypothetical protein
MTANSRAFRRDDAQSCLRPAVTGRAALLGAVGIAFLEFLVMSREVVQQVQITDRAGTVGGVLSHAASERWRLAHERLSSRPARPGHFRVMRTIGVI